MGSTELAIIEQRDVVFYDDTLTAIQLSDGGVYAPVRQMCQILGIDTQGQTQRIRRQDVLGDGLMVCKMHTIQGERATNVLRVDLIPFWLSGVRTKMVRDEIRPKLELLQKKAARVLWNALQTGELSTDMLIDELAQANTPAAQAYKMVQAMAQMARQQLLHEAHIAQNRGLITDNTQRIELIEATLGNSERHINTAQASRISQAVKAIGLELGKRSGRNEFGGVYGELYRRFEIAGYRELPAARYDEAFNFLSNWYSTITNTDLPF